MLKRSLWVIILGCMFAAHAHAQMQTRVMPVRVITFPGGANLPLWIAEDKGFFAREGLAVKVSPTPNSVVLVQSLMKGEQDIALSAFDNIVAYQEGQGEVALEPAPDFFAFMALSHGTVRLVANADNATIADLKGKTLGVDAIATGYSLVLMKLLSQAGLKEGDYRLESIGGTAARARALMDGKTPATIITTPLELAPETRGFRRLANVIDVIGPYQTIVGMARRSWATANRDALVGFTRATVTALDWLLDPANRAEAAAIYRKNMSDVPEAAAAAAVAAMTGEREGFQRGGAFDRQGLVTVLAIRSEFGKPQKSLTDPARYVDDGYLRAATAPR
jgi:ABC-type nitrate/sulfonate/bicarbonate transport system substrate-binding protein